MSSDTPVWRSNFELTIELINSICLPLEAFEWIEVFQQFEGLKVSLNLTWRQLFVNSASDARGVCPRQTESLRSAGNPSNLIRVAPA